MKASTTHLVVIPSYNTGPTVYATVRAARAVWSPVWVVVDGSDDGTAEGLRELAAADPGLTSTCCRATSARVRRCCMPSRRRARPASATR